MQVPLFFAASVAVYITFVEPVLNVSPGFLLDTTFTTATLSINLGGFQLITLLLPFVVSYIASGQESFFGGSLSGVVEESKRQVILISKNIMQLKKKDRTYRNKLKDKWYSTGN